MAKTNKKNIKKTVIFDFTEYYNNLKDQEMKDREKALVLQSNDSKSSIKKTSLWQKIKNLFKKNK